MCGRKNCMFLTYLKSSELKELDLTPPSVFIGRSNYPKVYAGPMLSNSNLDFANPEILDSPNMWKGKIEDIVKLRMKLARGIKLVKIDNFDRYITELQEVAASVKHVDVETNIENIVKRPNIDSILKPVGFSAKLENFKVVDNPKIPLKVEKLHSDEVKATHAVYDLFKRGFSSYYIQRLFSVGMFGERKNRKLVPTRWSITAVHDIIGECIKKEISQYESISDYLFYSYEHFGNRFAILISPGKYFFGLIEIWYRYNNEQKYWIGFDSENSRKKKKYSTLSGGYYAARLPVLEYLRKIKKQGSVIVIREVTPEYVVPLGVWVVEEGVRRAFNKPTKVESKKELIELSSHFIKTPINFWMKYLAEQVSLERFICL